MTQPTILDPGHQTIHEHNWVPLSWPNFHPGEFVCRETGLIFMVPAFINTLQKLRNRVNRPLTITSGYRSPLHSVEAAKTRPGSHAWGRAADIKIRTAEEATELAYHWGWLTVQSGVGINLEAGFVHLDIGFPSASSLRRYWVY